MERNNEIENSKPKEPRARLDEIVSEENADNWWKPELFEMNTLPTLPNELEIVEGVPNEEKNYNCFASAPPRRVLGGADKFHHQHLRDELGP